MKDKNGKDMEVSVEYDCQDGGRMRVSGVQVRGGIEIRQDRTYAHTQYILTIVFDNTDGAEPLFEVVRKATESNGEVKPS